VGRIGLTGEQDNNPLHAAKANAERNICVCAGMTTKELIVFAGFMEQQERKKDDNTLSSAN